MFLFGKCFRGRDDCEAIDCSFSCSPDTPEDKINELDVEPDDFICSGLIKESERTIEQDCYRMCFYSKGHEARGITVDEMSDNDTQDLTTLIQVAGKALALDSLIRTKSGSVAVPTDDGGTKRVNTLGYHSEIKELQEV